jgi:membrane peptidoglycan carboxypeptidase
MNSSYGDSANSAHGRARVRGFDDGYDGHAEGAYQQPYDAYDSYRGTGYEPSGYEPPPVPASSGVTARASVPVAPVSPAHGAATGRASVGRATVRPPDILTGPGGPDGPNGPDGPGGPGGGRGGPGRSGSGKGRPRRKKAMRRNVILSAFALFIILSGLVVVGGTYYFDSVKMPDQLPVPNQSTTIYYSDGVTPMAKIGNQNRTIISMDQIPKDLQHAVVSAEDASFYTNGGVDFKGVLRAAWNNFTGGDREGASTITQQYARNMADLEGVTYARKIREAVIAMKLSQDYKKDQILWAYLNTVYFGRGAYGVEAAAQAYFNKDAQQLTVGEDMVLAALIKQPEPDGSGNLGFDPAKSLTNATDRWNYVKSQMVKGGYLQNDAAGKLTYPTTWVKPADTSASEFGKDTPTGFVVHQVMSELTHDTNGKFTVQNLKTGGFKIITTINKAYEDAAIAAADDQVAGSVMSTQPKNLQASLVAIQPGTGEVLAYYGGPNGSGGDYAGIWADPVLDDGSWSGYHHQPGSTFKIYTLATALSKGIGIDSIWDGPPSKEFPEYGRTAKTPAGPVTNIGESCPKDVAGGTTCTLQMALALSLNTVYYAVGATVGPANVLDMAKAMGIKHIWAPQNVPDPKDPTKTITQDTRYDLSQYKGSDLFPSKVGYDLSIGQYGITTLDNADGFATIAARGVQADTHFVKQVEQGAKVVWREVIKQTKVTDVMHMSQPEFDDEAWAMQTVNQTGLPKNKLASNRPAGAKTGTWQYGQTANNMQAWYGGFTPQIATAVNITSRDPAHPEIQYTDGKKLYNMNGANTPGDIWKKFMDTVLKGQPVLQLPTPKHVGDPTVGNAPSPVPTAPTPDPNQGGGQGGGGGGGGGGNPCFIPLLCQTQSPSPRPSKSH